MHRIQDAAILAALLLSACSSATVPTSAPATVWQANLGSLTPVDSLAPSAASPQPTLDAPSPVAPATPPASTAISNGTWTATARMIGPHGGHAATLLNDGRVLVVGNCSGASTSAKSAESAESAELYHAGSRSWATTGGAIDACGATVTLLPDGRVLLVGGLVARKAGIRTPLATARLYDPVSGAWSLTGSMSVARYGHTATMLRNGKVLVAGGRNDIGPAASAELYDPATGSWTATGNMTQALADHTATQLADGTVLVIGGSYPSLASSEMYDPATESWTATASMSGPRVGHSATLLRDGTVLVAGGAGDSGLHGAAMASAELYDPTTASWTTTGSMLEADAFKAATLLPDGRVLVAGGFIVDAFDTPTPNAELYDPLTRSWSIAGLMLRPSTDLTSTLLRDGTVLVAGGTNTGRPTDYAEIYQPGSR